MKTLRRRLGLAAAALGVLVVTAGPVHAGNSTVATESVEEGAGDGAEEGVTPEDDKIQLPESSHDRVGLILLIVSGLGGLLVADNIRRRLKGEGEKATGEFRWR
jgi:hypothetical protein